jgi:hypothetical protein
MYFGKNSCAPVKRKRRTNGRTAEINIITVFKTMEKNLFFLKKSHRKNGNASGVKVTKPFVRKPKESINPERKRKTILPEL